MSKGEGMPVGESTSTGSAHRTDLGDAVDVECRTSPEGTSGGGVLEILSAQHAEMRDLITEVADSTGVSRRRSFDVLRELPAVHETAEELLLRPVSKRLASHGITAARDGEERQIAEMLAALEKLEVDGRPFVDLFAKLAEALIPHIWLEEAEEFPAIQARLAPVDQQRLGAWIERALALAPTHPHPVSAGSPVAQWAVGPFAALLDRARDGFARAGQALDVAAMRRGEW